jgi:hypothetical protein
VIGFIAGGRITHCYSNGAQWSLNRKQKSIYPHLKASSPNCYSGKTVKQKVESNALILPFKVFISLEEFRAELPFRFNKRTPGVSHQRLISTQSARFYMQ